MDIHEILFAPLAGVLNTREFQEKSRAVQHAAFDKIFADHEAGALAWKRQGGGLTGQCLVATNAKVKNAAGEEVEVLVMLYYSVSSDCGDGSFYLVMGQKNGPTLNSADVRVKNLAKQIFG